ncbi:MAG: PRC-barrel domain-containing protein [Minisyncoccia bacterium]
MKALALALFALFLINSATAEEKKQLNGHPEHYVGLSAFSAAGDRIGEVRSTILNDQGLTTSLIVSSGGFLGLDGRLVLIPIANSTRRESSVVVNMTGDEIAKLPEYRVNVCTCTCPCTR